MALEEPRFELVSKAHHTSGTARIENVDGVRLILLEWSFCVVDDRCVDKSGWLDEIFFGIPSFNTIWDSSKDVSPFGKPTACLLQDVCVVIIVAKRANLRTKSASGWFSNIASTESPESKQGFDGSENSPDKNNYDYDREDFNDGGEGFDEFWFL